MTIRAKLAINVISLVVFFLIIALVLNIASPGIEEATVKGEFANRIVIGVSDMNAITHDYVMNPAERARQQWERKHASLGDLIANARFTQQDMRAILDRIKKSHEETAYFFVRIVVNNQKKRQATVAERALLDESTERNAAQLMARSQLMTSDAYALSRTSQAEIRNVQSWSYWLITAAILIAMLVAGAFSFFLTRSIDVSIRTLKKGTEIVAGGDLTHRVTARGKDEMAQLAQAFNDMTGKLSMSYKSLAEEVWDKEKAREALRIANLYTRSLIEVSLDPLVTISADGEILDVNHATELATGVPREQLIGSDFSAYFTDSKKAKEGYGQAFSEGFIRDYPLVLRHVSGRTVEVLYNAATYRNEKGDVQGVFAAARDVTELRAAQRALQKSHGELELRVAERTAELLARTTQLETANRELEDFCYTVSHDLRAPLRAIDGFSSRLLRDCREQLDQEGARKLTAVSKNARKMGQLIDDLLTFSRLGRKELNITKIDLEIMANDVWQEISEMNPGREMDFRIVNMRPAFGDASLVRQVLVNLLSNAAKFTRERNPARIEAGSCEENGDCVHYVKDNGVGFDMQYHHKLFGVFERLHLEEEYEGTGVGLAIVQRIVGRHGGRVWAESAVNEGAVFYFTLGEKEMKSA